jgi:hypothetical protein
VREAAEFLALDAVEAHLEVPPQPRPDPHQRGQRPQHDSYLARVVELERGGRTDVSSVRQTEARRSQAEANLATAAATSPTPWRPTSRSWASGRTRSRRRRARPSTGAAGPPSRRAGGGGREAPPRSPTVLIATADVDVAAAEPPGCPRRLLPPGRTPSSRAPPTGT